jgi:glycosyltransferase involved in cell wall biosynthesis
LITVLTDTLIIAVNTRLLLKNKLEGIGRFTYETLKIITQSHPEHLFIFIFDRPFDKDFVFSSNIIPVVVGPQARHPFLFYFWFEYSLNRVFRKYKPDVFFSPDGYLSLSCDVQSVAVMHDLNFEHYPDGLPWLVKKYYRYFFPKFAHKAARIATVSEFSKKDISETYKISPAIIDVVYNGVSTAFKPIDESAKEFIRRQYAGSMPFFLFLGSIHPRKNITNLLQAFGLFKLKTNSVMKLIIAGEKYYWTSDMEKVLQEMPGKTDVLFTGRLEDAELSKLLASAMALTYVSVFEGFGIPLVEAMQTGVPVLASDVSSIPEIADDAALYCNPDSVQSIANGMEIIASDEDLRKDLILKGFQRVKSFNWNKTAEKLWETIVAAHSQQ